ncbi:uncharacterized protein LOC129612163 [Condylostylus longicornis]|uniref:uncharacterized protein LOC129612163 n=1 Tax=Condylostylus longicornis TaxID=2530218 RepID=UPI00244DF260|nr:uncharacterized protein LOC129612163 [Condylostylus longicornis]
MFVYTARIITFNTSKIWSYNRSIHIWKGNAMDLLSSQHDHYYFNQNMKYCVNKKSANIVLEVPSNLENTKPQFKLPNTVKQILNNFMLYIEEISHLDDVRKAQEKVMLFKDQLKESGDEKRRLLNDLNSIRQEIQKNHNEIASSMRGTERYVALVREEMNLLKSETKKQIEFNTADEMERQLFNNLTTAINDSYEKEKVHSNFIKILGLMGTLTASVVTLIASAIGHFYHNTKFGLVAKDFKENVTKTIKDENISLKDSIRLEIQTASFKQEKILKEILNSKLNTINETKKSESWTEFFSKYIYSVYYYFIPKKNT